jgi:hypothetical protein
VARIIAHARKQMARRRISESDVEQVLAAPELSYPSHTSGRHVFVRNIDGRRIAVVVDAADHEVVITTFDQLTDS